jgi:GTPase
VEQWRRLLGQEPHVLRAESAPLVIPVSSVTGAGLEALKHAFFLHFRPERREDGGAEVDPAGHVLLRPGADSGYQVERTGEHAFRISGPSVERLVQRHDLENEEALAFIEERLKTMGVIGELEAKGFEPGEEIEIGDVAFALYPGLSHME